MDHIALAYPLFDGCGSPLEWLRLYHSMQQLYNRAHRDGQIVYGVQILLYEEHRHPQCGAQVGYEGGDAHTHSALPYHLATQVHRGIMPLATTSTPTLEQLVLGYFHTWRWR